MLSKISGCAMLGINALMLQFRFFYPKKRVFGVYLMSKNWKEVIIQLGADQICPFMKQTRGCLKVQ